MVANLGASTPAPALTLYHAPHSRSSVILWLMEELGQPYELSVLNLKKQEQQTPAFLKINPMGKVPAIVHNGVAVTEAAAIACYLADAYPDANLAPPIGDPRRGPYLKWLFFWPSCFEPALVDKMLKRPDVPRATVGWGSYDTVLEALSLGLKSGPYLLGEHLTAADLIVGGGLRWVLMWKGVPERPEFVDYVARLNARPAYQRASARDAALASAQGG